MTVTAALPRYVLRRVALVLLTLLLVSIMVFFASQVLPGDVGRTILGPYATPEQVAHLNHELGTDQPLLSRYFSWLGNFVTGDWGQSQTLQVPIRPLVFERLGHSLLLAMFAFFLVAPLSVGLGVVAAKFSGRAADRVITLAGISLIALPEFVVGVVVVVVFAVQLGWFPVASSVPTADPVDVVRQLLLPSIPLLCVMFGYISQMTKTGTLDALGAHYTRTAVLKGLPGRTVLTRHVLRNGLLPTVTVLASQLAYMIGGLAVVEVVFNYPGIGKLVIDSATSNDLATLQACVLVLAAITMVLNLAADLLYGFLNPRIRVGSR